MYGEIIRVWQRRLGGSHFRRVLGSQGSREPGSQHALLALYAFCRVILSRYFIALFYRVHVIIFFSADMQMNYCPILSCLHHSR
jgi:hypothetical protein